MPTDAAASNSGRSNTCAAKIPAKAMIRPISAALS
jgi:hypothetical protein